MRPTRRQLALLLAAAALPAGPVAAAPKPVSAVSDPRGDWALAAADIVALRFSTPRAGQLAVELVLAAAPDPTAEYDISFSGTGACDNWDVVVSGAGSAAQRARWQAGSCVGAGPVVQTTLTATPVPAVVRGTSIVVTLPYEHGLKRGVRLMHGSAEAFTAPFLLCVDFTACVVTGDTASGRLSYPIR